MHTINVYLNPATLMLGQVYWKIDRYLHKDMTTSYNGGKYPVNEYQHGYYILLTEAL